MALCFKASATRMSLIVISFDAGTPLISSTNSIRSDKKSVLIPRAFLIFG